MIRRRQFITLLGGAAVAWPLAARAQQREKVRLIGILLPATADNREFQARLGALLQGLQQSGWSIGRNLQIDTRWATAKADEIRRHAAELAALAPDVIVAHGASTVGATLQATHTVPVVFPTVGDPVAAGFVDSLARPGGNATGFMSFEYNLGGKWLEPTGTGVFGAIQSVAPVLGIEAIPLNVRDADQIKRALSAFARPGNGGLIVTPSSLSFLHRDLIIALAAQYKLPALYFLRPFVTAGGLISYGPDEIEQYRQAAGYVDRILKGEKPADLPVQAPVKYELAINLRTAKALGLEVPPTLLARADEVIE